MNSEELGRDEVQMVHNMRRNPFFRRMIEKVMKEFKDDNQQDGSKSENKSDKEPSVAVKEE